MHIRRLIGGLALLLAPALAHATPGYSGFANGPPAATSYFPIAVWARNPLDTQAGIYTNAATAMSALGMNTIIGVVPTTGFGQPYPERFGDDNGEYALAQSLHIKMITGIFTPWQENASAGSVASVKALVAAKGGENSVIGYNMGDEPYCQATVSNGIILQQLMNQTANVVSALHGFDSTRPVFNNFGTGVFMQPQYPGNPSCLPDITTSIAAIDTISLDYYPVIAPFLAQSINAGPSDYISVPRDLLFGEGLGVQAMVDRAGGKPVWVYINVGNAFGFSGNVNTINGTTVSGSTTLTSTSTGSPFTSAYVGLTLRAQYTPDYCTTVNCVTNGTPRTPVYTTTIPVGMTVVSVQDATHLTMSSAATATGDNVTGPHPSNTAYVEGGDGFKLDSSNGYNTNLGFQAGSDCLWPSNICVVSGVRNRSTAEEVNADVWEGIIAGATGLEYFCEDSGTYPGYIGADYTFCLGGRSTNTIAQAAAANLIYVNANVNALAPVLNTTSVGACSLRKIVSDPNAGATSGTFSTATSCSGGGLAISTSNTAGYNSTVIPARAMLKAYAGVNYLFAQSDQRSSSAVPFTFTATGLAGKTATIIYDSAQKYHPVSTSTRKAFTLSAGAAFTDSFGGAAGDYQVKIYSIQ